MQQSLITSYIGVAELVDDLRILNVSETLTLSGITQESASILFAISYPHSAMPTFDSIHVLICSKLLAKLELTAPVDWYSL